MFKSQTKIADQMFSIVSHQSGRSDIPAHSIHINRNWFPFSI